MNNVYKLPSPFDNVETATDGPDGKIQDINKPSNDHQAMASYWDLVDTIIDGIEAMRDAKTKYLPQFPKEDDDNYEFRLKTSTMTNVYRDIVEGLANKPFAQEAELKGEKSNEQIQKIVEDIDGRGNNLHVFLAECFFRGINSTIHWILVDYPNIDREQIKTVADEREAGVKPYWVHVPAKNVLEIRSTIINGREQLTYARIFEPTDEGDTVRVFDRRGNRDATAWRVYKKDDKDQWFLASDGTVTINLIPLVPFYTGRRKGSSWQFYPVMRDAADLQVELFQKETGLKHARILTCFPMLAANGIEPVYDGTGKNKKPRPIALGPMAVLYAPPNDNGTAGSWERLDADAASMKFLQEDIDATIKQMRELGRQPLTAQSGNVTRISSAFAASKGNSAVAAWAINLKDATELALKYTELWLGNQDSEPEVEIFTDFQVESDANPVPDQLTKMRDGGDLSRETYWFEMQRNGVLSSNFDAKKEKELIMMEHGDGEPDDEDIQNAGGNLNDPLNSQLPERTN